MSLSLTALRHSRPIGWIGRKTSRFVRRSGLLAAVLVTILLAVGSGFAAYLVLHWLLPPGVDPVQPKDLTQFALTIAAGIGGVVALVVAYRRQHGIEQSLFVERFGAAASQLGHSDVAVRLAGVYAMAGVADETSGLERQQCVDVLCAYLRLPYAPECGASHQIELQRKVVDSKGEEHTRKYSYRQNDREVRQTIVRVIASRLQRGSTTPWSRCNFDFHGAALEDAWFSEANFRGSVSFNGVTFTGQRTDFGSATFNGGPVSFDGAVFSSRMTSFGGAKFAGATGFSGAIFSGEETSFILADFRGPKVSFVEAGFTANHTSFDVALFRGGWALFDRASFDGIKASFDGSTFKGALTSLNDVAFRGCFASFSGTKFKADITSINRGLYESGAFEGAEFEGSVHFHAPALKPIPDSFWDE